MIGVDINRFILLIEVLKLHDKSYSDYGIFIAIMYNVPYILCLEQTRGNPATHSYGTTRLEVSMISVLCSPSRQSFTSGGFF